MLSDIEIAQSVTPRRITEIARAAGIPEEYLEQYGGSKAKVDYNLLRDKPREAGKLVLVTAINPSASRAALRAAGTPRSFLWKTLICISRATSTP